ncbi:AAA family ATPase [Celeribacter naphthalenivorans]|uniref:AAA family ATPase n=1 Tax=Celeribacter naphthalenivorans TaxID=1614694 RepID=UPI001CFA5942|nr:AAA family ATPase [Celeribacter naphthalenivorans]
MRFHVLPRKVTRPRSGKNEVFLTIDHWNDYSYVTSFHVYVFDENGVGAELPNIRIGFVGQTTDVETYKKLEEGFEALSQEFFSLGIGVEYYRQLHSDFSEAWRAQYLEGLQDVVWNLDHLERVEHEKVFQTSHLRSVTVSRIRDQYASVLRGDVELTDFDFGFQMPQTEKFAGFDLQFKVSANSTPSTNMHALIGRNGVGKTTLLTEMVNSVLQKEESASYFYKNEWHGPQRIVGNYFNRVLSVAFSAFDPFELPAKNEEETYQYIGLTDLSDSGKTITKSKDQLYEEFIEGLKICFGEPRRKSRWIQAVETLQSDKNFEEMRLLELVDLSENEALDIALRRIKKMSSGHTIVILIMTLLVANVEEKTLVLFDEPEGHLHPPLLSALMRSLSQLLFTRNAVAIIATHSPVVLQEIPASCVWKVFRERRSSDKMRPKTETFGENVGVLTREVFGLEVEKSGFHNVLRHLVERGGTYDDILETLGKHLGAEARGILRAMVANRDENDMKQ